MCAIIAGIARIGHDPVRVGAVKRLARGKEREANARRDALHQASRRIVNEYDGIAGEALVIKNMLRSAKGTAEEPGLDVAPKSGLNRSIADAGWEHWSRRFAKG
jgi:putative transposase